MEQFQWDIATWMVAFLSTNTANVYFQFLMLSILCTLLYGFIGIVLNAFVLTPVKPYYFFSTNFNRVSCAQVSKMITFVYPPWSLGPFPLGDLNPSGLGHSWSRCSVNWAFRSISLQVLTSSVGPGHSPPARSTRIGQRGDVTLKQSAWQTWRGGLYYFTIFENVDEWERVSIDHLNNAPPPPTWEVAWWKFRRQHRERCFYCSLSEDLRVK